MSPEQLLASVEKLGTVDEGLLTKIRKQINSPDKKVSAKAIVKLLLDRHQISKAQARELLGPSQGKAKPTRTRHEEIEVNQPDERVEDSDQLLAGMHDQSAEAIEEIEEIEAVDDVEAAVAAAGVTRVDFDQPMEDNDAEQVFEIQPGEVQQVEPEMGGGDYRGMTDQQLPGQLNYDPFADPSSSGALPAATSGEHPAYGFSGKKHAQARWSSRWLLVGPAILGFLVLVGIPLTFWLLRTPAEQMWNQANEAFANGEYGSAIEQYDKFMKEYPNDERHDLAKVKRVESLLAQSFSSNQWEETYKRATSQLPDIEALEEFREIRDSLSDILPKTARGFTELALNEDEIESKATLLSKADAAMELVETPSYIPSSFRQKPAVEKVIQDVKDNQREIRYVLQMEREYGDSLSNISNLIEEGKTDEAMKVFQSLTSRYKSLLARQPLIDVISQAAEKERQNVVAGTLDRSGIDPPAASAIRRSLILARQNGANAAGLEQKIFTVLVDGAVYGVQAVDGSLLWRHFVGLSTSIAPQPLSDSSTLICNQTDNLIAAIDDRTGEELWQFHVGEPFFEPAVDADAVYLTTATGKLAKLDGTTGRLGPVTQLPQPATARCCVADQHVYQPGQYSNFYVLAKNDLSCTSTVFVGTDHIAGSVTVPPQIVAGYLLLVINRGDYSNLHVFEVDDSQGILAPAQFMERFTEGEINSPPHPFERWLVVASDTGDLKMVGINRSDKERPVDVSAEYNFAVDDSAPSQRAMVGLQHYLYVDSGTLWIANRGLTKYRIIKSRNKFERRLPSFGNDVFLGPIQGEGEFLLTVRRRNNSRLASLAALNVQDHSEIWRTDFSAPLAGPPVNEDNTRYVVSSQGDKFAIDSDLTESGYSGQPRALGSTILQDLQFSENVELANGRRIYLGPTDRPMVLAYNGTDSQLVDLIEPADTPSCQPVAIVDSLVVASTTGHVCLVDPLTGKIQGTPFLPEVQADSSIRWARPAVISNDQLVIANRDSGICYRLQTSDAGIQIDGQFEHEGMIDTALANIGNRVFFVGPLDGTSHLFELDASTLQLASSTGLAAGIVEGPLLVGDRGVLLKLADDRLYFFEAGDLTMPAWELPTNRSRLAGPPVLSGDNLVIALASGEVMIVDAASGDLQNEFDLGQPLSGSPWLSNDSWVFPGIDGNLHLVDRPTNRP